MTFLANIKTIFFLAYRSSALYSVNDNQKRWMVFGIGLKVVVDQVRSFVEQEVKKEYINVKTNHSIDTQNTHLDDLRIGQTGHQGQ